MLIHHFGKHLASDVKNLRNVCLLFLPKFPRPEQTSSLTADHHFPGLPVNRLVLAFQYLTERGQLRLRPV